MGSEIRAVLSPTRVLATVSLGITAYMALLVAPVPEPVTKGLALAFTALMWGYLGWEFFDLLRAYARLYEDAPRASTFAELSEIGARFGMVIGPNSVRILVMVGTVALGETMALASRAPKLPGFKQATRSAEAYAGIRLLDAATGAEGVIVSVPQGTIHLVLAPHAVVTMAQGGGGAPPSSGNASLPKRSFKSFDSFKSAMGPAGEGKVWHHIIEQRKSNVERFGPEAIHNTENVIALDRLKHDAISAYYSPKSRDTGGMVVREWLRTKSYEEQRVFGLKILRRFGVIP